MPNPYTLSARDKITQVKRALRQPFSSPDGYELAIYMVDGERICRDCVKENFYQICTETRSPNSGDRGWGILGVDVYWEGPPEFCAHCNKELASEYGDPDLED